jgi:hypothetical protein
MARIEWPTLARTLGWIVAVAFASQTAVFLLLSYGAFGQPPEPAGEFLDNVLADFEFQTMQWPIEFAGTTLSAIGFLALGGLGAVVGRLAAATDARRGLVSAAFLIAGVFGAVAEVMWLGAKPIATSPQYCECGLLAEELMSRIMALNIVSGIHTWLLSGALFASAVGLVVAGGLGRQAGMPTAWWWLALITAVLALVGSVLPLFGYLYPWDLYFISLIVGILAPIWAAWLALRARDIWPTAEAIPESVLAETGEDDERV